MFHFRSVRVHRSVGRPEPVVSTVQCSTVWSHGVLIIKQAHKSSWKAQYPGRESIEWSVVNPLEIGLVWDWHKVLLWHSTTMLQMWIFINMEPYGKNVHKQTLNMNAALKHWIYRWSHNDIHRCISAWSSYKANILVFGWIIYDTYRKFLLDCIWYIRGIPHGQTFPIPTE